MKLTLVKKVSEAKDTKSFFWEPEKKVSWLPGQYFYFTLPKLKYPDRRGATRHFTIASSPTENGLLRLTTRIREESGYKKTLDEIKTGESIEGEGPTGTFILDEKAVQSSSSQDVQVFLAGGIGITPFRAFIKYNLDKNLNIPMYLIYSNSNSEFVYGDEMKKLFNKNVSFYDSSKSGHLEKEWIKSFINHKSLIINHLCFWVSGPPSFVNAMEDILEELKVDSSAVHSDKFTGY